MARIIQMFECEYCYKTLRKTKKGIENHEIKCFSNPKSRSCITCKNFSDVITRFSLDDFRKNRKCEVGICINTSLKNNCSRWEPIVIDLEDEEELI